MAQVSQLRVGHLHRFGRGLLLRVQRHRPVVRSTRMDTTCTMDGRVFVVTGATDGIGKHTATRLAEAGATVVLHGRRENRGAKAVKEIRAKTGNDNLEYFNGDLSSISQIHKLAGQIGSKYKKIDCLINNAGVYEPSRLLSEDGYEMTWAVNVLAPFLLTSLLLDNIRAGTKPRIINVSSVSQTEGGGILDFDNLQHEKGYNAHSAYGLSKLCAVCFTYDLAERLQHEGITVNTLDPGTVNTKMLTAGWGCFGIDVSTANNEFHLATDASLEGVTGKYFVGGTERRSCAITYDVETRAKLWKVLEEQTAARF
mmetsp:Transcript_27462/g.59985  ORF Transcript_27462/g.59985 Transcript_27462/m.59985 type:complete len:312 (+) Transcript_27462:108-1043(+)